MTRFMLDTAKQPRQCGIEIDQNRRVLAANVIYQDVDLVAAELLGIFYCFIFIFIFHTKEIDVFQNIFVHFSQIG